MRLSRVKKQNLFSPPLQRTFNQKRINNKIQSSTFLEEEEEKENLTLDEVDFPRFKWSSTKWLLSSLASDSNLSSMTWQRCITRKAVGRSRAISHKFAQCFDCWHGHIVNWTTIIIIIIIRRIIQTSICIFDDFALFFLLFFQVNVYRISQHIDVCARIVSNNILFTAVVERQQTRSIGWDSWRRRAEKEWWGVSESLINSNRIRKEERRPDNRYR